MFGFMKRHKPTTLKNFEGLRETRIAISLRVEEQRSREDKNTKRRRYKAKVLFSKLGVIEL